MKEGIHPEWYPEAVVTCSCGNSWTTGATVPEIRLDVCSNCHPFFTGEQRIVDTEGQVDRFYKRLQARDTIASEADARLAARTSPDLPVGELGINTRYVNVMTENGIAVAGDVLAALAAEGDNGLLKLSGFGRKALADVKKRMRERGYDLENPVAEAAEA
jgi:large subunit ribosomal protein L31